MLKRFHTAEQGNVAIVFALALLPMTAFAGAALDYSRAGRCAEQAADCNRRLRSRSGGSDECQHGPAAHRVRRGSVQGKRDPWVIGVGCHGRRKGGRHRNSRP